MSKCKTCGATVIWKKKPDGTFAPPENPDGSRHVCEHKTQGSQPGAIIGRLNIYGTGSATFTLKGNLKKTYALPAPIQKAWADASFLLPASNHPDIWIEFSVDSKSFIQQGWRTVQRPDWAAQLADPTQGEIKKPESKPAMVKPQPETTPAAHAEPRDMWNEEREEFCALLTATGREGMPALLQHLIEETDFLIAPSSTKYHDACAGGLLHHSVKVYHNLVALAQMFEIEIPEGSSLAIIALLHDLCKTNIYKQERKSLPRRDEVTGELVLDDWGKKIWDEQIVYTVDDQMPLGHGEKSVIMIQRYIPLTDTEIFAIRWHMMAYDDSRNSYAGNLAITNASDKYRIIPLFHMADLGASFLELREPAEAPQ
jgi:hypothetical protein